GNSSVVMVMAPNAATDSVELLGSYLAGMRSQFDNLDPRVTDTEARLGGKLVSGRRLATRVGPVQVQQDLFVFARGESAVLVVIQGSGDTEAEIAEDRLVRKLLDESFKVVE
ncbi:MAG: hypothetical protein JXO22_11585, partial [Phycisphaerae bacterium]|nr:hypothetical protein [Phycisphaerae bacterium]